LQHSLAVAEAHLALQRGITADRQVTVQTEPLSWRRYTGPGGEAHLIRPDLAACVVGHDAEGVFEDRWFLEVDMGTESIPTVLAKCRRYQAYYRTGIEQAAHGAFPRVLWILHGPRAVERHRALARHLSRTSTLEQRLFRLTSTADLPTVLWGSDAPSSTTTS